MSDGETIRRTNCRLCGYLCGLIAHVQGGRVTALDPDPTRYPYDAAIVRGCRRCRSNLAILDHPRRCNYPLKRVGPRGSGQWQRVGWDQALDEIATRLQALRDRFGPETLATSIGGARAQYWPLLRFMNLFGSPNNAGIGQICWNPAIWLHTLTYGWPIDNELDPTTTRCAVLWGINPAESDNSLLWRTIVQFKAAGGTLVVVDPRRTCTARRADLWLPVRPGTDSALALGLLHVILARDLIDHDFVRHWCRGFDELAVRANEYPPARAAEITGLNAADIERAARLYATGRPAALWSGRGLDQAGRGSPQALRALAILRAVTGNLDVPGASHVAAMPGFVPEVDLELGGRLSPAQRAKQLGADRWMLQTYAAYDAVTRATQRHGKRLPMRYLTSAHPNLVWQAMRTGEPYPIRALICMASNPLLSQADWHLIYQALKSLDLLVVLELFPTPTAALADYVLPAAGSLERPVLGTNAGVANIAYGGEAAIEPLYERRVDFDFWRALGLRLGQAADWPWPTLRASLNAILAPVGLTWESFCETGLYAPPAEYRKHESVDPATGAPRGFATPSGKVELYSQALAELGYDPLPHYAAPVQAQTEYPLRLLTGARQQPYYASEFRQIAELRRVRPEPAAQTSAETARAYGLAAGDWIWIETGKGRARFRLEIAEMAPGVISAEYGWWYPEKPAAEPCLGGVWQSNINCVTSADACVCDPLLGQWSYNGLPCRVYRVEEEETAPDPEGRVECSCDNAEQARDPSGRGPA